jgi:hypothetical protein
MTDARLICDYLVENYNFTQPVDYGVMLLAIEKSMDRIIYKKEDGEIKGMALYLRLTDERLKDLSIHDLIDPAKLFELINERGPNIHFIQLCTKNIGEMAIYGMKELIRREQPKTVSWFKPDLSSLVIKEFPSCPQ